VAGDVAVSASGIGKQYSLGQFQTGYGLLSEVITERFKRGARRSRPRSREEFWALRDIDFEIARGETFGIIGHNGAGKSTLLKILARVTPPTTGVIELRGRVGALLEVGTGFHAELTGRENVFLNGAILGMSRSEIERKFDEIVAFAEVEQFIDTPVKRYSSGMYLRLAFSVAAHLEPEILIVDEVLSVGDLKFQQKCLGRMEEVATEGRTVLFVSHNLTAVRKLCPRSMLLSGGRMVTEGDTVDVINTYVGGLMERTGVRLGDRTDRQGSGRLRFTEVRLARGDAVIDMPFTGEALEVVLSYETDQQRPFTQPRFIVNFGTVSGDMMLHLESDVAGAAIDEIPPRGELRCMIPRLPLPPGRYTINISAGQGDELLDLVSTALVMTVGEGDFYGSGRRPTGSHQAVLIDHQWSVSAEPGAPAPSVLPAVSTDLVP
jgi:lipopolysaccharide transport system ATP-binding protein